MPHAWDVEDPPPLSRSPTQLVAIFLVGGSAAGLPRPGALLLAGRSPPRLAAPSTYTTRSSPVGARPLLPAARCDGGSLSRSRASGSAAVLPRPGALLLAGRSPASRLP
jgi:hypothetical protein